MSSAAMSKSLEEEVSAKSPTHMPILELGLEHLAALDPARHALVPTSAQYLNPATEVPNRANRHPTSSRLGGMDELYGDPDVTQSSISVVITGSDPSGSPNTTTCGLQTSVMGTPGAATSQDPTGSASSKHTPLHVHIDDGTALSGGIYNSWNIVDHHPDTPNGAEGATLPLVVDTSPVMCWYCLNPAVKGNECCGFLLDCWCAACNISGERGKVCEFCRLELDVFEF